MIAIYMRSKSTILHGLIVTSAFVFGPSSVLGQTPGNAAVPAIGRNAVAMHVENREVASRTADAATRVYSIGVNDILRIELKDVPGVPRMVRVEPDGSIAYPLAGTGLTVAGKTAAEVETIISASVRTLSKGGVTVKVAGHLSHIVTVYGLVGDPGEQQIQRDAVPFFVIRAMSMVDPRADAVQIVRAGSSRTERHMLSEPKLESLLIYPGDSVEFGNGAFSGNVK